MLLLPLLGIGLGQEVEPVAVNRVLKNRSDAVDRHRGGDVEVGLSDISVVEGEIGGGGVGDEDGLSGEQSREAGSGLEELEVGEAEALRDDVVGEHEGVGGGEAVQSVVLRDEEGGAQRED